MKNIPSFQDFLKFADDRREVLFYDFDRFSSKLLKTPGNPHPKETIALISDTCLAITLTILTQYHQWIAEQIGGEDNQRSDRERR